MIVHVRFSILIFIFLQEEIKVAKEVAVRGFRQGLNGSMKSAPETSPKPRVGGADTPRLSVIGKQQPQVNVSREIEEVSWPGFRLMNTIRFKLSCHNRAIPM